MPCFAANQKRENTHTHTHKKKKKQHIQLFALRLFFPLRQQQQQQKAPLLSSLPHLPFFFLLSSFSFLCGALLFFLSLLFCLLSRELFKSTLLFFFRVFHTFELPVSSPLFFFVSISQHFFVWRSGLRFLHAHAHTHTQTQTHKGEDSTDQGKTPSFPLSLKKEDLTK